MEQQELKWQWVRISREKHHIKTHFLSHCPIEEKDTKMGKVANQRQKNKCVIKAKPNNIKNELQDERLLQKLTLAGSFVQLNNYDTFLVY